MHARSQHPTSPTGHAIFPFQSASSLTPLAQRFRQTHLHLETPNTLLLERETLCLMP